MVPIWLMYFSEMSKNVTERHKILFLGPNIF